LTQHMKRYWKIDLQAAKGYYDDKNKLTAHQKQRRIQREKKLKKFFGEAPDVPVVRRNLLTFSSPPETIEFLKAFFLFFFFFFFRRETLR